MSRPPRIGIALGGGSARGWAHIGVLSWLHEHGVQPHVICGTSIGALVAGITCAGRLQDLHDWAAELQWTDVLGYLDVSFGGGLIRGSKLFDSIRQEFEDHSIESMPGCFAAVATELSSGQEIWLRDGSMFDAIRASAALPGLFAPVYRDPHWLVDGGLVNPVPVSLCRALGADVVIAVDLNTDLLTRRDIKRSSSNEPDKDEMASSMGFLDGLLGDNGALPLLNRLRERRGMPSMMDVVMQSVYIMQVRITRARMAGDPPDILLTPKLADIGLMEFHRAKEAIAEGRRCVAQQGALIEQYL